MNRADLQQLSELRINEAKTLLDAGSYPGAYYLAGYAVECALKACIAKKTNQHDFPDKALVNSSYTHDLEKLLGVAGLAEAFEQDQKANPNLEAKWSYVKDWREESRYNATIGKNLARDLIDAISDPNGVLVWLKNRW